MSENMLKEKFSKYADFIANMRSTFLSILTNIATHNSVEDEINRSIRVLENADKEITRETPPLINSIAVYHSSNAILYTFVIYCLIPSAYVKSIYLRSSHQVLEETSKIFELFSANFNLPIELCKVGQRKFAKYAANTDVIIFTGRYENSLEVKERHSHSLLLFYGSGINALILGNKCNLSEVVTTSIEARLFNSGQDCMCPDVIFVHHSIFKEYLIQLIDRIKSLKFGNNNDSEVDYGSIFYQGVIENVIEYIKGKEDKIVFRGSLNAERMDPVVIKSQIDDFDITEFFSPVFNIVEYNDIEQVEKCLLDQADRAMSLSVFGEKKLAKEVEDLYQVVYDKTIFEFEDGNMPFGGNGVKASFVSYKGDISSRPILISREVARYFAKD